MHLPLQDTGNQTLVVAPPLVVEGLQRLGCEVVASTGFIDRLPGLAARFRPITPSTQLRARDIEVLSLVAQGFTNRQIGSRLGLAENTIRNYLREIHRRLGVSSRTEAVTRAASLGYAVLPRN